MSRRRLGRVLRERQPGRRACCARTATSRRWTSRPATATATRSRSSRGGSDAPSSRSPGGDGAAHARRGGAARTDAARRGARDDPGYYLIAEGRRALEADDRVPRSPRAAAAARCHCPGATPRLSGDHRRSSTALSSLCRSWPRHIAGIGLRPPGPARTARADPGLRPRASRSSIARSPGAVGPTPLPAPGAARRRAGGAAHPGGRADAADRRAPRSRSRSSGWRSTTSPTPTATCTSRCCPTGGRRRRDIAGGRRRCSPRPREGIARLNRRHGPAPAGGARFLLLHRRRVWNASEQRWMGWERKRGKLAASSTGCCAAPPTPPSLAPTGRPPTCPPASATSSPSTPTRGCRARRRRLVGTMAHPAQPARLRPAPRPGGRGLRRSSSRASRRRCPSDREGSLFQRIFSGPAGIDPYAAAVSDVYQDLFGEGSYTGKGIYDVDAFSAALDGRVPENTLLSHDLFEGIFARAGLVTDVELFEEFPAALRGGRRAPAPLGARRLAAAPVDLRARPRRPAARRARDPADRPLEDARQPPPHAVGAGRLADPARRLAAAARLAAACGPCFVLATIALPALLPVLDGDPAAARRGISKRSHLRALVARPRDRGRPDRPRPHLPGPPGVADGRRDRPHAVRLSSPAAGCSSG